ncbi:MAG: ferritin-like domain-containing protein, partial [candidate division NC10 bacterium]
ALLQADKIVALGGTPAVKPAAVKELKEPKAMLEYDLELERQAIKDYTERAQQAEAAGEIGLKIRLEEIIADETDHAEEILRLLGK